MFLFLSREEEKRPISSSATQYQTIYGNYINIRYEYRNKWSSLPSVFVSNEPIGTKERK